MHTNYKQAHRRFIRAYRRAALDALAARAALARMVC